MPRMKRRDFLKSTAVGGIGFWVAGGIAPRESKAVNEQLAFAAIGIGGKGDSDSQDAARNGRMVAICDVDRARLAQAAIRFPGAKTYTDFRKMLEEVGDKIDAVTVSTPDHAHAVASLMAMRMGKHCFCQKPLTQTIYEARLMGEVAREKKVITQMGNQGTAAGGLRKAAALLRAGVLGTVTEVHVWTNRPIWPQGIKRADPQPVPKDLDWDCWISRAPMRPYAPGYHPFSWRGWWDFGTGALGDMACHTMNMPFMGLDLRDPISVKAEVAPQDENTGWHDSFPKWSIIEYEFGPRGNRPALKLIWYDGGKLPDLSLLEGSKFLEERRKLRQQDKKTALMPGSGVVIVGTKGKMLSPGDDGSHFELYAGAEEKPVDFPPPPPGGHFQEWIEGIKTGKQPTSNFPDYAGPLTEMVLVGNLAVWAPGQKILWDAKNLKATPEKPVEGLERLIRPEPRAGYTL